MGAIAGPIDSWAAFKVIRSMREDTVQGPLAVQHLRTPDKARNSHRCGDDGYLIQVGKFTGRAS